MRDRVREREKDWEIEREREKDREREKNRRETTGHTYIQIRRQRYIQERRLTNLLQV